MLPDYFERREEQIEEVADLQKRIAKLRLYGPRSKDDLFLIYMIASGKLKVPSGAIWDPSNWYANLGGTDQFARGLFNPRRYVKAPGRPADYQNRWDSGYPGAPGGPRATFPGTGLLSSNYGAVEVGALLNAESGNTMQGMNWKPIDN
jgi:hypothetical protein